MRRLLVALACVLWATTAQAQVVVDAVTTDVALGTTSRTISHTTSGSNRYLTVCVAGYDGVGFAIPSGITFNSQAMSSLGTAASNAGRTASLWGLALEGVVSTGAFDVVVSFPGSADGVGITVISTNGTHQSASTGTYASNTSDTSPITVDASTAAADQMVVDCAFIRASSGTFSSITVGADQTQRMNTDVFGASYFALASTQSGSTGGVMTWDYTGGTSTNWATAAIPLLPSAGGGGGGSGPCTLMLLGVGKCN